MQQRTLLDSLHLYYQRKVLLLDDYSAERWPASIASFTKQGSEMELKEEGKKLLQVKIAAAKET